jgi:hypothetical protein
MNELSDSRNYVVGAVYGALENQAEWFVCETLEDATSIYQSLFDEDTDGDLSCAWISAVIMSTDFGPHPAFAAMSEWTCDGCLDLVPDGAGHYINDMRVCADCANKLEQATP